MLLEAWNAATEEFSEDWPSTTVQSDTRRTNHSHRELQSEGLGSHAKMDLFACSTWHSKPDSASAAATLPVAQAAVSSTALYNAANGVDGYTAGTLGAMMHDCVKWGFTGQQALKQEQERQTVLKLAQSKCQDTHDAPSCPLLKFITTEASQGGVIALAITKIIR